MNTQRLLSFVALAAIVSACGPAQDANLDFDDEFSEVEELREALNSNVACGQPLSANHVFTGMFSTLVTAADYSAGATGCSGAYFVKLLDYKTSANASRQYNRIQWGDTIPTTQAACEAATLNVYVFRLSVFDPAVFVANHTATGVWNPGFSFPPGAMCGDSPCIGQPATCSIGMNVDHNGSTPGQFSLTQGVDYMFAMRARDMTNPAAPVYKRLKLSVGTIPLVL